MSFTRTLELATRLSPLRWPIKKEVRSETIFLEKPGFNVRIFRGPTVKHACLVAPGVQPFGLSDEMMDIFCEHLASVGMIVLIPFLPHHENLLMRRESALHFEEAYDFFLSHPDYPGGNPSVFSISIGSYVASHLAATRDIERLFIFGGFLNWTDLIQHAISKSADPVLSPVVYTNICHYLGLTNDEVDLLRKNWLKFVCQTWRSFQKLDHTFRTNIADKLCMSIPVNIRGIFLSGCGLRDADDMVDQAVARARDELSTINLKISASNTHVPVYIAHGKHDNVIPPKQALDFYDALPSASRAGVYISDFYGHSQTRTALESLRHPMQLAKECSAHWSMIKTLTTYPAFSATSSNSTNAP